MLRLRTSRIFGGLLAVLYVALPGGAAGVRACAHHDAAVSAEAGAAAADAPAAHGHHGPAESSHESEGAEGSGHERGCSCLDTCAAGASIAIAPSQPVRTAESWSRLAGDAAPEVSHRPTRPDHFLPYPHGPPTNPA